MTVTEAAAILSQKADEWNGKGSIYNVIWKAVRKLSNDRVFNLAAYMKYSYGPCLHGEADEDWIDEAREVLRFADR